ncbi:BamA/TamA family outer membrane protein [Ferruginibacter lapsinanis]|uniref:translocation and assembly module lipoprotein TamL n=1 Tax=Ferruginibacter lapsinanis TaxID=563172 RepID=UPI001E4239BF|nr:BamA/TamA family outer membrane protein [Ferruginibacter lapsinanis]UEG50888.1 BamA/TamA family outer membrane protein [Ferruginibacter lapsinanis]
MSKYILYFLLILFTASSCSVRRHLPKDEQLYRGATIHVKKDEGVKNSIASLRKKLKPAVRPTANKFILGQPYKVWWWYFIGRPKREKGLKAWLRKKLGEAPVLSSRVNATVTAENMTAALENLGYFHSTVQGDTVNKSYFTRAVYTAYVMPQYKIKSIVWVSDSSELLRTLETANKNTVLKPGKYYSLKDIEAERSRLDLEIKTKGYYFFNPDYLMAYADSTIGNHEVDLFLNVKKTTPALAKHAFAINRITIFPNYTLILPPPDTSKIGTVNYDRLLIRDTVHKFKPLLFKRMITYRPGDTYSRKDQNTSLNRLISLGAFKFVKNRFELVKDTGSLHLLNAYYYLTPAKSKSLQVEIDGFSKENKYYGSLASLNWKNKNAFHGAEQLAIKVYGSFEVSRADSLKNSGNYRLGAQASIAYPRFALPFFTLKESNLYPPRTSFSLGYELFIKQSFYTQNIFRLKYEFAWKQSSNKEHTLSPIAITYLNAIHVTDAFRAAAAQNPSILSSVYSEVILSTLYSFTYNTMNPTDKNQFYFTGGADLSGNITGLITGAKKARDKKIFNTPFAQYVKVDAEVVYKRIIKEKLNWVNHFQIGIGVPYDNSAILPFSKQYTIGGASSIRGFPARTLGPGTYLPDKNDIHFFQTIGGDYKLLLNSEIRFPLFGSFAGAVFADIGNVWTKDTLLFGPKAQLTKDFYKELAVASGIGIRFDANVLLIRLDLGVPLRKPFLPDGKRWVFDQISFGDKYWRRSNLILNIAIGYPF